MRYQPAERLIALLLELGSSHFGLTIDDIRERFDVERRTAERLLELTKRLAQLEERTDPDRRKRWCLKRLPAVIATASAEELEALQLAVTRLGKDGLDHQAELLRQLNAKLIAALPDGDARRLETDLEAIAEAEGFALRPGPRQTVDAEIFDTLRFAVKACRKVRIGVRYRGSGQRGFETVHPYGFLYGNRQYLVAYSENDWAQDVRNFVLANIYEAALLNDSFTPIEGFSLKSYAERSFGVFQERPVKVAWRFSPKAGADAAHYVFHPNQRVTTEPDGSLVVEFTAGGLLEMCWHLFTWGGEVEIVRPQRLRNMMRELVTEADHIAGTVELPSVLPVGKRKCPRRPLGLNSLYPYNSVPARLHHDGKRSSRHRGERGEGAEACS